MLNLGRLNCKANEIMNKHHYDHIAMFHEAIKNGQLVTRLTPRTTWYSIVFSDKSRLGFRNHEKEFNLISWFYYI